MSFFSELKRRNVFRVATAYVVISWLLIQVANTLVPILGLSPNVTKTVLLLLILSFIPALFFSWAYEVTPEGIKKESEVESHSSITTQTAKKLDIITIGAALGVLGLFIYQQMNPHPVLNTTTHPQEVIDTKNIETSVNTSTTNQDRTANIATSIEESSLANAPSIAVLPFESFSNDDSDVYFGKGIAEELLNSLAKFPDLKVAARTSAFSFEGKNVDLREVGKILGVDHILEGSVRRSGDRLRITAQLIRVADGIHLWSETYDRQLTDIFAIQDEIVAKLSEVLQFQLGVGAGVDRVTRKNVDPRAYNEYLKGLDFWWKRDEVQGNRVRAISAFKNATDFDKEFADAWSAYAAALILSSGTSPNMTSAEKRRAIDDAMTRAFKIDPNNVRAYAASIFDNSLSVDVMETNLKKALAIAPNSPFVNYAAGYHYFRVGDYRMSIAAFKRTKTLDPLNKTVASIRNRALGAMGRYQEALDELKLSSYCESEECQNFQANDAWSGLCIALQVEQKEHIVFWLDRFKSNVSGWGENQPEDHYLRVELVEKFASDHINGTESKEFWDTQTKVPSEGDSAVIWASILAQHGHIDLVLDALVEQQQYGLFQNVQDTYILLPGPFELPETIRRHPRYHKLWESPELASLANARRANGQTAGLPLPMVDGPESSNQRGKE